MIFKLFTRAILLGSAGSAVWFSNAIDVPVRPLAKELKTNKKFNSVGNIEDIELFEKHHGCKIVFVKNFNKNENYKAREWFEQKFKESPKAWEKALKSALIQGVIWNGAHCKKGQILTLEEKNWGNFKVKESYK